MNPRIFLSAIKSLTKKSIFEYKIYKQEIGKMGIKRISLKQFLNETEKYFPDKTGVETIKKYGFLGTPEGFYTTEHDAE